MDSYTDLPDAPITGNDPVSLVFIAMKVNTFQDACRYIHQLPYGYNTDRDDPMTLFSEGVGSCTTKHAVIATLAHALDLPVGKQIGIYAMTEALVTGTQSILDQYNLPYLPMIHCFLAYADVRVDLTEGNRNGKNGPIDVFLHTEPVSANISAKDEYLKYRTALQNKILLRPEMRQVEMKTILHAREMGVARLKANIA